MIKLSVPGTGLIHRCAYLVKSISLGSITINLELSLDAFFIGNEIILLSSVILDDTTTLQLDFSRFQIELDVAKKLFLSLRVL